MTRPCQVDAERRRHLGQRVDALRNQARLPTTQIAAHRQDPDPLDPPATPKIDRRGIHCPALAPIKQQLRSLAAPIGILERVSEQWARLRIRANRLRTTSLRYPQERGKSAKPAQGRIIRPSAAEGFSPMNSKCPRPEGQQRRSHQR